MSEPSLCPTEPPTFWVLTTFPSFIERYFENGVVGRARERGQIRVHPVDLREFGMSKHRKVDAPPYGGGPGMVMRPEPIARALDRVRSSLPVGVNLRVGLTSAREDQLDSAHAREFAAPGTQLALVCGRYEGVDERVHDELVDFCFSAGHAVLSSGELAALALIDSASRRVAGVLGNPASLRDERNHPGAPVYTRPREFRGHGVPEVLLSGDHARIEAWRREQSDSGQS